MGEAARAHPNSLFEPGGPISAAAVAELRAHPRFPAALRTLGTGMLALYRGNRLLNMLINDRGRMQIGYLALYLNEGGVPDGRGRGFGVSQMKALCAAAGFASPGRTAAMLALMRMSGYIASASAPEDRRRHILVPTERLRAAHRDRWVSVAASLREIHPEAAAAFALDDPEFIAAYVRASVDHFLGGFRLSHDAAAMELFVERNAGLMVLFSIVLAGKVDDTVPPSRPVPVSISGIASRFGVSRAHVRTLLRDAEAQGLIERSEQDGAVLLKPHFAVAVCNFFANSLLYIAHCVLQARDEVRRASGSAGR
jgi:DNA-binding MarR family transcriptional regulator